MISISPIELFMQAGPVVKGVILILVAASIWCWIIVLECLWGLRRLKRAVRSARSQGGERNALAETVFIAGTHEAAAHFPQEEAGARRDRVVGAMRRRCQELMERAEGGLPNLAVIASVAPFVGLFGTVWGIMTSFAGIAEMKDTSLAVVAPGIAEALFATAIGLVAAIPAAFAYNRLGAAYTRTARAFSRLVEDEAGTILKRINVAKRTLEAAE